MKYKSNSPIINLFFNFSFLQTQDSSEEISILKRKGLLLDFDCFLFVEIFVQRHKMKKSIDECSFL
jgi:hypothetical protein